MATGTVKWFSDLAGFGVITSDDGAEELFAHHSAILIEGHKSLKEIQKVSYEIASGPKGPTAIRIKPT
jgi:CspA family cold shock protein